MVKLNSTIFRTIKDEATGATQSIGLFGKSFTELKTIFSSVKTNGLFKTSTINDSDIECINAYNDAIKANVPHQQAMEQATKGASDATKQMIVDANGTEIALDEMTIGAKMASGAMKALAVAGNMIAMWAIIKVIQVTSEKITELANASEIASEKAFGFANSVNNAVSNMSSNFSTLSSLNKEYKTLSEGVNKVGKNISLSTSEYDRYKEVVKQISDIMPNMTTYFNEQGEKIGFVKDELSDLNSEYAEYIKKQATEFLVNGDENGNTFQDALDNFSNNSKMGFWENAKNIIQNMFGSYDVNDLPIDTIISTLGDLQNKSKEEMIAYFNDIDLGANGEYLQTMDNRAKAIVQRILDTSTGEIRKMTDAEFNTLQESIANNIESLQNSNEVDMSAITSGLLQTAYSKDDFWAVGEDIRNDITTMLSSINAETWKSLGFTEQSDVENFVGQLIIAISSNKDGIADAWNGLFDPKLEELPVSEYIAKIENFIATIANALGLDEEGKKQFLISLGFDIEVDQAMINGLKEVFDDTGDNWVDSLTKAELELASSDEFDKALDKQKDKLNGAVLSANDYEVALQNVKDAQSQIADESGISIPTLEELHSSLDSIQKAYESVTSAIKEFNEQGYLSVDTYQALMEIEPKYLQYLMDEEGNLRLGTDAMYDYTSALIDNMAIKQMESILGYIDTLSEEQRQLYLTGQAAQSASEGLLSYTSSLLMSKRAMGEISDDEYNQLTGIFGNIIAMAESTKAGLLKGGMSKASNSSNDFKQILDKYLDLYEAELNAGVISLDDFLTKSRSMVDEYYRDGKISTADYWGYVEDIYRQQLSVMDKVLSAVQRRYDKEIEKIQGIIESINKENEALDKQLEEYDGILSAVDNIYEDAIKGCEEQQKAIDEVIEKLQEENDERTRAMALEQAKYNLIRSLNQKTKFIYKNGQMVYTTDDKSIKDARNELKELELEEIVIRLGKEKELIDEEIEKLEEWKEKWNEVTTAREETSNKQLAIALWGKDYEKRILENRIDDLELFKNNYIEIQDQIENNETMIESYEEKVEYYERLKEQWRAVTTAYEENLENQMAAQLLGADWEQQILSGRLSTLASFSSSYQATQLNLANAAINAANAQIQANNDAANSTVNSVNDQISALKALAKAYQDALNAQYAQKAGQENLIPNIERDETVHQQDIWNDQNLNDVYLEAKKKQHNNSLKKYGTGTDDAEPGMNLVGDGAPEIIRDNHGNAILVEKETLYPFEGGETVFNGSKTKEILSNMKKIQPLYTKITLPENFQKLSQSFSSFKPMDINMSNLIKQPKLPSVATASGSQNITLSIGDIHLSGVQDVETLGNAIVQKLPNMVLQKINKR